MVVFYQNTGIDANKWALLKKSNTVGLTMLKLGKVSTMVK